MYLVYLIYKKTNFLNMFGWFWLVLVRFSKTNFLGLMPLFLKDLLIK
jgi:hypothetical protein